MKRRDKQATSGQPSRQSEGADAGARHPTEVHFQRAHEAGPERWEFIAWKDADRSERGFRHEFYAQDQVGRPIVVTLEPLCPEMCEITGPPFPAAAPIRIEPCYLVTPPWRLKEADWEVTSAEKWEKVFFEAHGEVLWLTKRDRDFLRREWRTRRKSNLYARTDFERVGRSDGEGELEIVERYMTESWAERRHVSLDEMPKVRTECLRQLRAYSNFDDKWPDADRKGLGPWFVLSFPYRPVGTGSAIAGDLQTHLAAVRYRVVFPEERCVYLVAVRQRLDLLATEREDIRAFGVPIARRALGALSPVTVAGVASEPLALGSLAEYSNIDGTQTRRAGSHMVRRGQLATALGFQRSDGRGFRTLLDEHPERKFYRVSVIEEARRTAMVRGALPEATFDLNDWLDEAGVREFLNSRISSSTRRKS